MNLKRSRQFLTCFEVDPVDVEGQEGFGVDLAVEEEDFKEVIHSPAFSVPD